MTFFISWTLMIGTLLYIAAMFMYGFDLWIAPAWNAMVIFTITNVPDGRPLDHLIFHTTTHHPIFTHIAMLSMVTGGITVIFHVAWQWLSPIEHNVFAAAQGASVSRIDPSSDIGLAVINMAKKAHIKPPKMYLIYSSEINAFAISKPFRSAIAIYRGTTSLSPGCQLWIIGHELGHIKYKDTSPAMLRIATAASARWFQNLRTRMISILFPIFIRIPVIRVFVLPMELLLVAIFYCTLTVQHFAMWIFTLIDKAALRTIEYRADKFASTLVSARYGIELMELLGINEGKVSLMQDHPPALKRGLRLRSMLEA